MLTSNLVRVRFHRQRVIPRFIDPVAAEHVETAERLIDAFSERAGASRGELDDDLAELFADQPGQFVRDGLVKLLEDRCTFEVESAATPADVREAAFRRAAAARAAGPFDRTAIVAATADELGVAVADVEAGLFADLKSEQRLTHFEPTTPERLLRAYNVALAQGVLLKAVTVTVDVRRETPARLRRLFRTAKFRRLVCEATVLPPEGVRLRLDGPMSLFSATQKYGVQLALFLPVVLSCRDFELRAELRWGPQRKEKTLELASRDGLVADAPETGTYVPPELAMFAEQFRKKHADWVLSEEAGVFPLGDGFWVPDYLLKHGPTGRTVYLEVLGFWRRSSAEAHLKRLKAHAPAPYVLAVSDQLKIDDADLDGLPAEVVRFRQMPLPDEVAKRAAALIAV